MPALLATNRARPLPPPLGRSLPGGPFLPRCPQAARLRLCVANHKKELPMFLSTLLAGISRWLRYRDTLRQLSRLTDRELSDLGIHRGDIRAVAWSGR